MARPGRRRFKAAGRWLLAALLMSAHGVAAPAGASIPGHPGPPQRDQMVVLNDRGMETTGWDGRSLVIEEARGDEPRRSETDPTAPGREAP